MKYYITCDTHFNHKMLVNKGYRHSNYSDLIFKGLSLIKSEDILIHLGDVSLGNDKEYHNIFNNYVKCKTILVKGNHDGKSNNWYYNNGWDFVCEYFIDKFYGKYICFSHKPRPKIDRIDLNIHGHLHDTKIEGNRYNEEFESFYDKDYHKCLALEHNNYKLFNLKDLI